MEILKVLIAYLIGSIHFAYIIGKILERDISKTYDENLGAYNLYRSTGSISLFLLAGFLDGLKAFLPTLFFGTSYGFVAILGHVFSIFSYFKTKRIINGMGIASTIGFFLAFDYRIIIIYAAIIATHKLCIARIIDNKIRIFGKHLYQVMYFYLTILLYSTFTAIDRNSYIVLISIMILLSIAFGYRWVVFVRKKVLPIIGRKKLEKLMEEK